MNLVLFVVVSRASDTSVMSTYGYNVSERAEQAAMLTRYLGLLLRRIARTDSDLALRLGEAASRMQLDLDEIRARRVSCIQANMKHETCNTSNVLAV